MTFSSGGTTVTFNGALFPANYESKAHQNAGEAEDGTVRVYDRNVLVEFVHLEIKDDHDNLLNIRNFIHNTAEFKLNAFTFTPDSNHNVGNGDGGAITVRYWGSNFIERQYKSQLYKYTMILRREVS